MTAPTAPSVPPPGVTPDLLPPDPFDAMDPDALVFAQMDPEPDDVLVGVPLGPLGRLYTYAAPPHVHVGSIVILPPSWFTTEQTGVVDTLEPPPCPYPIKRVLGVLT